MIKNISIILLLIISCLNAQENRSENVELPEFIITGTERIRLPILSKKRPKLISTLSEEFFLPTYSADQISLLNFENPLKRRLEAKNKIRKFDGKLTLKSGMYTLPYGDFLFDKNYKYFLMSLNIYGSNETDYLPNAGYNTSGANATFTFFVNKNSKILPGLKIGTDVSAYRDSYKFFGSDTPSHKRETDGGVAKINLIYKLRKSVNFNFDILGSLLEMNDYSFRQKRYSIDGGAEFNVANAGISVNASYLRLNTNNDFISASQVDYLKASAQIKMKPFKTFTSKFGIIYSQFGSNTFISPIGSFQLKIDENIFMFGEYSPKTELIDIKDHLKENLYINAKESQYNYVEHNSFFKLALKYEYGKKFETGAGIFLETLTDMPYYSDKQSRGAFDILTVPKAARNAAFVDLLFHPDYWGSFYAQILVSDVRDEQKNLVPYQPLMELHSRYSYEFKFNLSGTIKVDYYSQIYSDLENKNKLNDYLNLSLNLKYKLTSKVKLVLEFDNVTNNNNYLLNGYKLKPLEIIGGVEYRW